MARRTTRWMKDGAQTSKRDRHVRHTSVFSFLISLHFMTSLCARCLYRFSQFASTGQLLMSGAANVPCCVQWNLATPWGQAASLAVSSTIPTSCPQSERTSDYPTFRNSILHSLFLISQAVSSWSHCFHSIPITPVPLESRMEFITLKPSC